MRLYTFQGLEVASILYQQKVYEADWAKCCCFHEDQQQFNPMYEFMRDQYNRIKGVSHEGPPIFWYTSLKEVITYLRQSENLHNRDVLLQAEVPKQDYLLYDSDAWNQILYDAGLGAPFYTYPPDKWTHAQDARADSWYDLYKKNTLARLESYKEIFNVPKSRRRDVHAITSCIKESWLKTITPAEII